MDINGSPVSGKTVTLLKPTGEVQATTTNSQGRYSLFTDTASTNSETIELGDAVLESTSDPVIVYAVKCPAAGICN